jgi:hypothetical protein
MKRLQKIGLAHGQAKPGVIPSSSGVAITAAIISVQYLRSRQWLTKEKRKRKPNRIFNYS